MFNSLVNKKALDADRGWNDLKAMYVACNERLNDDTGFSQNELIRNRITRALTDVRNLSYTSSLEITWVWSNSKFPVNFRQAYMKSNIVNYIVLFDSDQMWLS